jgi:hypothetical protein
MYENLMEEVVSPENYSKALKAVIANGGAPGIDGMTTEQWKGHLQQHWPKIQAKLMAGSYTPDASLGSTGISSEGAGRARNTRATRASVSSRPAAALTPTMVQLGSRLATA